MRKHSSTLALRVSSSRKSGSCLPNLKHPASASHCCLLLEHIKSMVLVMVIKLMGIHLRFCSHRFTGSIKKRGRCPLWFFLSSCCFMNQWLISMTVAKWKNHTFKLLSDAWSGWMMEFKFFKGHLKCYANTWLCVYWSDEELSNIKFQRWKEHLDIVIPIKGGQESPGYWQYQIPSLIHHRVDGKLLDLQHLK